MTHEKDPREGARGGQSSSQECKDPKANDTPTGAGVNDAVSFLRMFRPGGPWTLSSIVPNGRITTTTFRADQQELMRDWIENRSGHENLYFLVNFSPKSLTKKANKADISRADWLHVDVDPNEDCDDLEEERRRILSRLREADPTIIIDSGGGYQGFWRIEPVSVEAEEDLLRVEGHNRWLAKQLGGDHCHNIDRIMRLPFTVNLPNKTKLQKGRKLAPTKLLRLGDESHKLDDFGFVAEAEADKEVVSTDIGPAQDVDFETLPERVRSVAFTMCNPSGEPFTDRSEGVFYMCCEAARAGVPPEQVVSLLLDRNLRVSAHVLEQKQPDRYARRQVKRAYDIVAEDMRGLRIGLANANVRAGAELLQDLAFRRGGEVVRLAPPDTLDDGVERVGGAVIAPANPSWLFLRAAEARWIALTKEGEVRADPPRALGRDLQANPELFRPLKTVLTTPTVTLDGEVLTGRGWQRSIWFEVEGEWPEIGDTKDEARAALTRLMAPFELMPYVGPVDRAVAASALLCALMRTQMRTRPAHIFDATTAGSGKSMHADVVGIVGNGHEPAHLSQGWNNEELEKRLTSALRAGDPIVSVDNCIRTVEGDWLTSALTSQMATCRVLGSSVNEKLPNATLFLFTGNGMQVSGDMHRRCAISRLDPQTERPELKTFPFNPVAMAHERRREMVAAGLTIVRAYIRAGCPEPVRTLGSFEDWDTVRGALVWLGEADPADSTQSLSDGDPRRAAFGQIATLWPGRKTVRQVLDWIYDNQSEPTRAALWEAMQALADRDDPSPLTLGRLLGKRKDSYVADRILRARPNNVGTMEFWFDAIEREPKML